MLEQNYCDYKDINELNNVSQKNNINNNTIDNINLPKKRELLDFPDLKIHINEQKLKQQHKLMIQNIEVYFPYEPYPNQLIYMEKMIQTLNNKKTKIMT